MNYMERVEYLWKKFNEYKQVAEQHEFHLLFKLDSRLEPLYEDLKVNYREEHAKIFICVLTDVLEYLKIEFIKNEDCK